MAKDVLIYKTMGGTVKETAEKVRLAAKNNIDVFNIMDKPVIDFKKYNRVFIGTAIYASQLPQEITAFLQNNSSQLKDKNVTFFIHGLAPKEEGTEIANSLLNKCLSVNKNSIYYLGGKLDSKNKSIFIKLFYNFVAKKAKIDAKNPNNINEQRIAELLKYAASTN